MLLSVFTGIPYTQVINYQDNFTFLIETANSLSYNTLILKLRNSYDREEFKRNVSEKILTGIDENKEALFPKLRQVFLDFSEVLCIGF